MPVEQGGCLDEHAVLAVAALRHLLVNSGLLQRVQRGAGRGGRVAVLPGVEGGQALRTIGPMRERRVTTCRGTSWYDVYSANV